MRFSPSSLLSSPTDLANFLSCRYKTTLDLLVARGRIQRPTWNDPLAVVLRDRGTEHERRYVERLRVRGLQVVDLTRQDGADRPSNEDAAALTVAAMRGGADVIVQAPLLGSGWFGYADILHRVAGESALGDWHYEVHDAKLVRETRGGTIVQLCVYSDVVAAIQGRTPEFLRVVTPEASEAYRVNDFDAFYRTVAAEYRQFVATRDRDDVASDGYPQPVEHCDVCRWWERCNARRRQDDHLSFVSGLGRAHQAELEGREIRTLAALSDVPLPLPFTPDRGSSATYARLREQARLQRAQRESHRPVHELLPVEKDVGLSLLPPPSPGDLFLDLEGDPFARHGDAGTAGGREYLIGFGRVGVDGTFAYHARWAFTDDEERAAFESVIDEILAAVEADPGAHVYHFAPYEPAAFKRLMGRYATREAGMDGLLRGGRFVDLYAVVRQAIRAGVESYSIKKLEPLYGFTRELELERAGDNRRVVEFAIETGDVAAITDAQRIAVETYNKDDCRSTHALRDWLERVRQELMASGTEVPRPEPKAGAASETVSERRQRIEALRARLLAMVDPASSTVSPSPSPMPQAPGPISGPTPQAPSLEARALRLLAFLLDWHYREDKVAWWEYYRLLGLADDELESEPGAVTGLSFHSRVDEIRNKRTGRPTGSVVDRYTYPPQEMEIRPGGDLKLRDERTWGTVVAVDRIALTMDVRKGPTTREEHATSAFAHERVSPDIPAASIFRLGELVADEGIERVADRCAGIGLLLNRGPRVGDVALATARRASPDGESVPDFATRIAALLRVTVLPIQGPPGSGKTFTGARMICELVKQGRRVGVTANSHRVIRNLLEAVAGEAAMGGQTIRLGHRNRDADEVGAGMTAFDENDNTPALEAICARSVDVVGGTAWLWSHEDAAGAVDVLVVDEAGQMSLANVLAVSMCATSLVLLGDPQQLEQPQKGSHPDGVDVSALQHTLGPHQTMPEARGLFLPETWRLAPAICAFTSESFYEGKLRAKASLAAQRIEGSARFSGAGVRLVEVSHDGCRNRSDEEVDVVAGIVAELVAPGVVWVNEQAQRASLTAHDILVVAAYNAHVVRLQERLASVGARVGTVDKFQGQEAPVVIYSMATSRPEDAPRGMAFLYSRHRLNVATSRARCVSILVASPRLFEPDCQTPAEMRLANALCRYRELAKTTPSVVLRKS